MNRSAARWLMVTLAAVCSLEPAAPAAAQSCGTPLACPVPSPGSSCVSGQLYDLETGSLVRAASPTGSPCTLPTASGPCSVDITAFEAFDFSSNPLTAFPLTSSLVVDDCGHYVVEFAAPVLGFAALATDDAAASSNLTLAARIMPIADGGQLDATDLYAVLATTDQAWTTSAGDPFTGPTFAETGVYVALFRNSGQPASGVVVTRAGSPDLDDDYYFADANPLVRSTVGASLVASGANGAGLMVDSGLVSHSGTGGESPGCVWPSHLGDAIPGVVMVQEFDSIDAISAEPCTVPVPVPISAPLLPTVLLIAAIASLQLHGRRA